MALVQTAVATIQSTDVKEFFSDVKPVRVTNYARVAIQRITAKQKPLPTPEGVVTAPKEPTFIYGVNGGVAELAGNA